MSAPAAGSSQATLDLVNAVRFPAIGIPVNPEHLSVFTSAETLSRLNGPTLGNGLLTDLRLVQADGASYRVTSVRKLGRRRSGFLGFGYDWAYGFIYDLEVLGVAEGLLSFAEAKGLVMERLRAAPSSEWRAEIAAAVRKSRSMAELVAAVPGRTQLP